MCPFLPLAFQPLFYPPRPSPLGPLWWTVEPALCGQGLCVWGGDGTGDPQPSSRPWGCDAWVGDWLGRGRGCPGERHRPHLPPERREDKAAGGPWASPASATHPERAVLGAGEVSSAKRHPGGRELSSHRQLCTVSPLDSATAWRPLGGKTEARRAPLHLGVQELDPTHPSGSHHTSRWAAGQALSLACRPGRPWHDVWERAGL